MKTFIDWLNDYFAVRMKKVTNNVWIQSVQNAILMSLPMILVSSLISLISILGKFTTMPDLSPISNFSFGIFGICIAFLLPYYILEKRKMNNQKLIAGLASIGVFLMLINLNFTDEGVVFDFSKLGAGGMPVALLAGSLTAAMFMFFKKYAIIKDDSLVPEFIANWFNSMLPITVILLISWISIYVFNLDVFALILSLFSPLKSIAQTLPGFVLFCFIPVFLYTIGISSWVVAPITWTVALGAIAENTAAFAAGQAVTNITTFEVIFSGWLTIGGQGATLILNIFMLFSLSKRLKAIGKATIVPSIFNINEPLVFGAPIAWNPLLMIPMWINAIVPPIIVYLTLKAGWVTIPYKVFGIYNMPFPISTYLVNQDPRGLVLFAVVVAVVALTWYPFFKAYEKQLLAEEAKEA